MLRRASCRFQAFGFALLLICSQATAGEFTEEGCFVWGGEYKCMEVNTLQTAIAWHDTSAALFDSLKSEIVQSIGPVAIIGDYLMEVRHHSSSIVVDKPASDSSVVRFIEAHPETGARMAAIGGVESGTIVIKFVVSATVEAVEQFAFQMDLSIYVMRLTVHRK